MIPRTHARVFIALAARCLLLAASVGTARGDGPPPATTRPAADGGGTETIVFLRHGEKPAAGLGQLSPKGLNRAIALSKVLPGKFGRPDFLFAPDPAKEKKDGGKAYCYVRPLLTIEPTAVALEMPVDTVFGYSETDQLTKELSDPKYAHSVVFVAWEHTMAKDAAVALVRQFGGDATSVPAWPSKDYDSLYVVRITRAPGAAGTAAFQLDHEGLDGQSASMPSPASEGR
jgi:hypothetical protein